MEATDLKIIQHLYFKNVSSIVIFDPNQQLKGACPIGFKLLVSNNEITDLFCVDDPVRHLIFNLSEKKNWFDIHHDKIENIVYFNQNNSTNSGIEHFYINNPDGSIRWMYPSTNQAPVFLSLYNNSGWKAKLYKAGVKISFTIGLDKIFSQGYFTFEKMTSTMFDFLPNQFHDDYAIFTGTAGENRKVIVALAAHKHVTTFAKIPLTTKAKALVDNESQQLNYIRALQLVKMTTPNCNGTSENLQLSNIKPISPILQSNLTHQHLEAISEYYQKTVQYVNLSSTKAWSEIQSNLRILNDDVVLKNDLNHTKIQSMIHQLNQIVDWLGDQELLSVGLAHGDFTPWNMYLTKEKIQVYDWEMSRTDMPLLFDIFHYIFQNQILIKQGDLTAIKNELRTIRQHKIVEELISKHSINWSIHYAFYLVYITSYYLPLYISQQDLHMQAHWLVDVWSESLDVFSFPEVERVA